MVEAAEAHGSQDPLGRTLLAIKPLRGKSEAGGEDKTVAGERPDV